MCLTSHSLFRMFSGSVPQLQYVPCPACFKCLLLPHTWFKWVIIRPPQSLMTGRSVVLNRNTMNLQYITKYSLYCGGSYYECMYCASILVKTDAAFTSPASRLMSPVTGSSRTIDTESNKTVCGRSLRSLCVACGSSACRVDVTKGAWLQAAVQMFALSRSYSTCM